MGRDVVRLQDLVNRGRVGPRPHVTDGLWGNIVQESHGLQLTLALSWDFSMNFFVEGDLVVFTGGWEETGVRDGFLMVNL